MSQISIRFCGFGGQGIVLSAIIIAYGSVIFDSKEAVQTQSYGPESRGGASKAEVIVADHPIDYPLIDKSDVLIALSQESVDKYFGDAHEGSWVIVDPGLVRDLPQADHLSVAHLPAAKLADELGSRLTANMITLGALIGLTQVISVSSLEKSIMDNTDQAFHELNIAGMQTGLRYAREMILKEV
jgi:2-oxoglutarate ferredoxin oxidoreductase subunit gamma